MATLDAFCHTASRCSTSAFLSLTRWLPPAVLSLDIRRCGAPGFLTEDQWRIVLACAAHPRRLSGLACMPVRGGVQGTVHRGSLGGGGLGGAAGRGMHCRRRLLDLLDKSWHSLESLSLKLESPLDEDTAQLWTLLASMPRLRHLELSMSTSKGDWLCDPDVSVDKHRRQCRSRHRERHRNSAQSDQHNKRRYPAAAPELARGVSLRQRGRRAVAVARAATSRSGAGGAWLCLGLGGANEEVRH